MQGGATEVDYASWPVKELARFLKERGIDPTGIVEKAELVAKVIEVILLSIPQYGRFGTRR